MSDPSVSSPYYPPSSKSSFWTAGKKIVAVILIVMVAASVVAAGAYYGLPSTTNTSNLTPVCSNGATNYPSCTACHSGQTLAGGSCRNNCTNGAVNPTACNTCPAGQTMVRASCVRNCTNGTSNPPACDNNLTFSFNYSPHSPNVGQEVSFYLVNRAGGILPVNFTWTFGDGSTGTSTTALSSHGTTAHTYLSAGTFTVAVTGRDSGSPQQTFTPTHVAITVINPVCSNGAVNYPDCTLFTTSMTLTCTPSTIMGHSFGSTSCEVRVSSQATTTPTGSVGFSATLSCGTTTATCGWSGTGIPCTLTTFAADTSNCSISQVSTIELSGTMTLNANYGGDTTHKPSSASLQLVITAPPATVTVSGSVSAQSGCIGCDVTSMLFHDASTNQKYGATVSGSSYTISLQNFHNYDITINWSGIFGHGNCSKTLMLNQSTDTLTADYKC